MDDFFFFFLFHNIKISPSNLTFRDVMPKGKAMEALEKLLCHTNVRAIHQCYLWKLWRSG